MSTAGILRALRAFPLGVRIARDLYVYGGTGEIPANPADEIVRCVGERCTEQTDRSMVGVCNPRPFLSLASPGGEIRKRLTLLRFRAMEQIGNPICPRVSAAQTTSEVSR